MYIVQVKKNSSSPFPKLVPLDSIPEQDNTKFVVRQARSRLKLWICDGAEQLSTLLVAIKMRNQIDNDLQDELFGRMEDNGTRSTYQYHC